MKDTNMFRYKTSLIFGHYSPNISEIHIYTYTLGNWVGEREGMNDKANMVNVNIRGYESEDYTKILHTIFPTLSSLKLSQ